MRIACLGDSNTRFGNPLIPASLVPAWPEFAVEYAPQHTWLNVAWGGGTVCEFPSWSWSKTQLEDARTHGPLDYVVAAFGTNDFRVLNRTRDDVIKAYCVLKEWCAPTPLVVCTTPWCTDRADLQPRIVDLNARLLLIEKRATGWRLAEFFNYGSGVDELQPDGCHLTEAAQRIRAKRVIQSLT